MALPSVKLRAAGKLTVNVLIGQAQFGTYELWLWNREGTEKVKLGEGINSDDSPDVWELAGGPPANDGKIVHWRMRIAAPAAGPGQTFSARVSLRQAGKPLDGGTFAWKGPIGAAPVEIEGGARLLA